MKTLCAAAIAIVVVGYGGLAQVNNEAPEGVELTGNWVSRSNTEFNTNLDRAYDYLGMPMSDAAKAWALSHSEEQASEPERQCAFYTSTYFPFGFAPLPMWKETELRTGSTVAWVVGGWLDVVPMMIWMDGRPHPSAVRASQRGRLYDRRLGKRCADDLHHAHDCEPAAPPRAPQRSRDDDAALLAPRRHPQPDGTH